MAKDNHVNRLRARNQQLQKSAQVQRKRIAAAAGGGQLPGPITPAQRLMASVGGTACNWKELTDLFETMGRGIHQFLASVAENYDAIKAAGKETVVCSNVVRAASTDCEAFVNQLVAIKNKHISKQGPVQPEDLPLYYTVGDEYNVLWQKFQTLSFQTATEITSFVAGLADAADQNVEKIVDSAIQEHQSNQDPV